VSTVVVVATASTTDEGDAVPAKKVRVVSTATTVAERTLVGRVVFTTQTIVKRGKSYTGHAEATVARDRPNCR
jgi:hypothetical protein